MSNVTNDPRAIPGLDLPPGGAALLQPRRHALGLPAGSIRAMLALLVLASLWGIVYFEQGPQLPAEYVYLQFIMILILGHYFAAHGSTIRNVNVQERSPLGLPRGSIRFLLLAGYAGLIFWQFYFKQDFKAPETFSVKLPLVMLSAFLAGYLLHRMVHQAQGVDPPWLQDVEAWVALLGMVGLSVIVLFHFVIHRSIPEENQLDLTLFEEIVAGIVGFYFGARS